MHDKRLLGVLSIAAFLYITGNAFGVWHLRYAPSVARDARLPAGVIYHPDEFAYVGIPYRMLVKHEWNPHYYHNPTVNLYTNLVVFALSGAESQPHNLTAGDREIAPFNLYVLARSLSALYMVLAVAVLYATGKLLFGKRAGLWAAAIMAFSPLVVQHAHYATPNAQATLVMMVALWLGALLLSDRWQRVSLPRWALSGLAGVVVGFAAATRYNVGAVGVFVAVGWLRLFWQEHNWRDLLVGGVGVPLGFVLGMPPVLIVPGEVFRQIQEILAWYQKRGGGSGATSSDIWQAIGVHWRYLVLAGVGPLAAALAVLGIWQSVRERRAQPVRAWATAALVLYALIYTVLALRGRRLQANLLFPLIAVDALLAGHGLAALEKRAQSWPIRIAEGVGVLAWPLVLSLLFVARLQAPDNRYIAQQWLYTHITRGTPVVLLGPYNVPLDPLDYPSHQFYAAEATLDLIRNADAQILVYSDAYPFKVLRAPEFSTQEDLERERAIVRLLQEEWHELARFPRWPWPLENQPVDDVSYWHQMEIVVYCHTADCPVHHIAR